MKKIFCLISIIPFVIFAAPSAKAQAQIKDMTLDKAVVHSPRNLRVYKNYKQYKIADWFFSIHSRDATELDSPVPISKIPELSPKGIKVYKIITPLQIFNDSLLRLKFLIIKVKGRDTSITRLEVAASQIKNNKLEIYPGISNSVWPVGTDVYIGLLFTPRFNNCEIPYKKYYFSYRATNLQLYKSHISHMKTINQYGLESPFTIKYAPLSR